MTREPPRSSWTARRSTESRRFWTPVLGAEYFSTWSIGKGTVRRSGPGSMLRKSWSHLLPPTSIGAIRINRPQDPMVDPGVVCPLASGAARRRGALSRIKPLWLPPSTTRGISHPSTNQFIRTPIPTKPRAWD